MCINIINTVKTERGMNVFTIDKMSRTPIYEQLIECFEKSIISGDIGPEGQLPSVRALSQALNVNPNTLQRAYAEIERRGLCYTVPGNGRFISKDALERLRSNASEKTAVLEKLLEELRSKGVKEDTILTIVKRIYGNSDKTEGKVTQE